MWPTTGASVDAGARPGQAQRLRFLAPAAGTYRIVCTAAGHAAAGMLGNLTIDP